MKIRKSSWHYRVNRFVRDPFPMRADKFSDFFKLECKRENPRLPKSLCGYFWQTIALCFAYPFVFVGFGIALIIFIPAFVLCDKVGERRERKHAQWGLDPKEPGLVRSFVKARKRKVCPLIEVVDG